MTKSIFDKEKTIQRTLSEIYLPPRFEDKDRLARVQALLPEIDEMYRKHAEKNAYPGYVYGIVLDGELIHSGCGGYTDIEGQTRTTPQSMFRIASMTKSFTAMAILKLRDEEKLRLDDRVDQYIPELQAYPLTTDFAPITIRDLLTHTAGLPTDDPWADRKLDETEDQLLALLKNGLNFSNPPGTVFEYSNLGYTILGYLIKKITGSSYQEFINQTIFQPLGIEAYWEFSQIPKTELAYGYSLKEGKSEKESLLHDGVYGAMGGLITSIESFSKYLACHQAAWPPRNDSEFGPLKRSSIREMHQPLKFVRLETAFKFGCENECSLVTSYGYGLRCLRDSLGRVFIGHQGGLPGFGSNWYFLPEYGLGIVSFANLTYADTSKIDLDILNKILVESKLQPRKLPTSTLLKDSKNQLISLLPHWKNVVKGVFADNFFLDRSLTSIQQESMDLFAKAGRIISIDEVTPENQLSGHFRVHCEKGDLQISFSLTPENPCLIQQYQIKHVS